MPVFAIFIFLRLVLSRYPFFFCFQIFACMYVCIKWCLQRGPSWFSRWKIFLKNVFFFYFKNDLFSFFSGGKTRSNEKYRQKGIHDHFFWRCVKTSLRTRPERQHPKKEKRALERPINGKRYYLSKGARDNAFQHESGAFVRPQLT